MIEPYQIPIVLIVSLLILALIHIASHWGLRPTIWALLSFGRYKSDCYYCEKTISSRNFLIENLKIAFHLAVTHGRGPDNEDVDETAVREHMEIYGVGPNSGGGFDGW